MKKYLCVFTGSESAMAAWQALQEEERLRRQAQGIAAWKSWAESHQGSIVEMGGPLGKTKKVSKNGMADIRNNLAAFVTVQAESQEAAAQLFVEHPHFMIFPGEGVEIMEILPMPGA